MFSRINIFFHFILLNMSFIWSQCDFNEDGQLDILDIISTVNCILVDCFDESVDTVFDIDGNEYQLVQIGEQIWMKENLIVTHYRNGDDILTGYNDLEWGNINNGAFAVYGNNLFNLYIYGLLYNWYAVEDEREICPDGFHVPTEDDWGILIDYLGENGGGKMKSIGTLEGEDGLWFAPNEGATNESGFTGFPSGNRSNTGEYQDLGSQASFWSITPLHDSASWRISIFSDYSAISNSTYSNFYGFSVRCLSD